MQNLNKEKDMSEEKKGGRKLASEKLHEFLEKNYPGADGHKMTAEMIRAFHDSPQFEELIAPLPPAARVGFCIKVGAFKRVKQIYEDCKKEQAYFPVALSIEAFMNKHKELFANEQVH